MNRRIIRLFCILVTGVATPIYTSAAETPVSKPIESQPPSVKPQIYTHPITGYTIAIPPGSSVLERDEANPQISIRSRKGYMISLQSGPARPEVPLAEMPLRLEDKYLGTGKPWSHKGKQVHKQLGGLPAIEVSYEGANTRSRVNIIRGARTDHVLIFFASARDYQSLVHEYEWMLSHFRAGPDDIVKPLVTLSSDSSIFSEQGYGYSIRYPNEWITSKPSRMTAMFSGKEGTPAYAAIVSVQNVAPPAAASAESAAQSAMAELQESLQKSVQSLSYIEDRPWDYVRDAHHLNGREIVLSYKHAGQGFIKRVIVVPRPFQNLAHIWSYTAPVGVFEDYAETADRMLKSWKIITSNEG